MFQTLKQNFKKIGVIFLGFLLAFYFIYPQRILAQEISEVQIVNPGDVVINELAWMGSLASSYDEWVELKNTTQETIDLSGWQLTKVSAGQENFMLEIPAGFEISPEGFFIIARKPSEESILSWTSLVDSSLSLSNSSLAIGLYPGPWLENDFIDVAGDGKAPLAGENSSQQKASMERNKITDEISDGTDADSWHNATDSRGFLDQEAEELATPGEENSTAYPVASAGENTWGLVGEALEFNGSASSDPEDDILEFFWDFGDGTSAWGEIVTHAFSGSGLYVVTLTVSDGFLSDQAEIEVVIYSGKVAIIQIYPNPPGADAGKEWVILKNLGTDLVDLEGWRLKDSKGYSKKLSGLIEPGSQLKIEGISFLNNSGEETIYLCLPNGQVISQVSYSGKVEEGAIYLCDEGGNWRWIFSASSTASKKSSSTKKKSSSTTKSSSSPSAVLAQKAYAADGGLALGKDFRFIGEKEKGLARWGKIFAWILIIFSLIFLVFLFTYPSLKSIMIRAP